ncbi:cell growth regulator with ring finger domain protein 1-like protein [Plakobranchus ocellatus]|uniref:Cell growth regulator with ring finger domain protein 1-like protein n=1 Tax=Plakobranchus ocellatus TaxID=259542 RepID=A0AAV4CUD7_9GAST|nr:cell growth regulator with ring finger domain protein 1-like protein [Plakobranchus ocellatus]
MAHSTLLWFAEYSNVSSVVIVVVCFIAMAAFITLVSMNADLPRMNTSTPGVEQRNMVKVVNPFFLQMEDQMKLLKDGLKFHLSRLSPCKAVVLWGVKINSFHDVILKTGHEIRRQLLSEDTSDSFDLDPLHKDVFEFSEIGDGAISLLCPDTVSSSALGNMPRQRYPVTVFVFLPESGEGMCPLEGGESECSNNIVGLISIIHLRDEIVTQASHVIQQYIKTAGVPIYSLQPMFVNTPSESESIPQSSRRSASDDRENITCAEYASSGADTASHRDAESCLHNHEADSGLHSCSGKDGSAESPASDVSEKRLTHQPPASCEPHSTVEASPHHAVRQRKIDTKGGERQLLSTRVTTEENTHRDFSASGSAEQVSSERPRSAECVVCQTRKVKCVLLPCRHASICFGCFKLLDRCPMCRAAIESYFILRDSDENEESESSEEESDPIHTMEQRAVNVSFVELWERFNMRLNALLGFR